MNYRVYIKYLFVTLYSALDMTKRPLSDLKVSPEASVEGIVCSLSPMKKSKGCSYFDGVLSDDTTSVRFFGFDSSLHQQLKQFHKEGDGEVRGPEQ